MAVAVRSWTDDAAPYCALLAAATATGTRLPLLVATICDSSAR
jgi:hypothetical protein